MEPLNKFFTAVPEGCRVARWYRGGKNLDYIFGEKSPEGIWHFPELWVLSRKPAINDGRDDPEEGLTFVYDRRGNRVSYADYEKANAQIILGEYAGLPNLKLLDSLETLPKEYHPGNMKPEAWIGLGFMASTSEAEQTPAFFDFRIPVTREEFRKIILSGDVKAMESIMNRVKLGDYELLNLPGGIVHSLGKGMYAEVLGENDVKTTLQDEFAGRELSLDERYPHLYVPGTSEEEMLDKALDEIDFSPKDLKGFYCRWQPEEIEGEGKEQTMLEGPFFGIKWRVIDPGKSMVVEEERPYAMLVCSGQGKFYPEQGKDEHFVLRQKTTEQDYLKEKACFAGIVHANAEKHVYENTSKEELRVLCALPPG
ncbi:hypothetical protein GF351_04710 [Candidatus Woesearchaeota archaeon]|nr:hypothetical protein [Candidatus Woesearchaeota archaeon]